MASRDIIVFGLVFGSLPFILWRPYVGVLVWSVLGYLSPHRLTWGLAYDFRFSLVVGAVLVVAVVISRESKRMIWTPVTCTWLLFFGWTCITTWLALDPTAAAEGWARWWKISLVTFVTVLVMQTRERIHWLVWVIVISLGFYGVKGGIFTVLTGGSYRVYGAAGSFIEDNNSMGLALILTLPLMRYLQLETEKKWVRVCMGFSMVCTAFAILGTQSRGALLGLAAMGAALIWKSQRRLSLGLAAMVLVPVLWTFMPESWHARMNTIGSYEQDGSALGRINAWWFAFNLAKDHPLFGGGFNTFNEQLFKQYAPEPEDFHDAHSIYFEVLGEQGFFGLAWFLMLAAFTMHTARRVIVLARDRADLRWAKNLCSMIQASIVGYAVSGAFLGLAYFDLVYHLIALVVLSHYLVNRALADAPANPLGETLAGIGPASAHPGIALRRSPATSSGRAELRSGR